MSGILRLESLTKGNTLKQGDKTPLKYKLFDADGDALNIAGKSAKVRLVYPDFLTIGYEKDGLTVAQDDTVTFTIDSVIHPRMYHVEIIVDDKFIFPSREDESKFTIDKSSLGTEANIIEVVGVDAVVKKAVDLINKDPNLIIDEDRLVGDIISNTGIGSIEEYYQQFNDVITELSEEKDYHSLPEIAGARGGEKTLGERLDKEHNEVTAQLAQKASKGEIAQSDLDKNTFDLDSTWFGADFIQELNNGTIEVTNVEDDSLTTSKYINRSVTYPKLGVNSRVNIENQSKITTGEPLKLEWIINKYITSALHHNGEGTISSGGGHYLSEPFFVPKNTVLEFFASQTDAALILSEWSAEGFFLNPIVNGNKKGTKYYYEATHDMYLRLCHAESYSPFSTVYIKTLNSDTEKINTILEGSELDLNYINAFVSSVNYTGGEGLVIDSPNYRLSETFFVPKGTKINVRASGTLNVLTLSEWDGLGGFVAPIFVGDNAIKEQEYIADKDIYLRVSNGTTQYPENLMGVEFYGKLHDVGGGGGEAYDQPLNTTDDVKFNSLKTTGVIPMGTLSNPPKGLLVGDMWIDTSDSSTNPIVRVKL